MAPRARSIRTFVGVTVGALVVLLVGSAATTAVSRAEVGDSQAILRDQLLPMMTAVDDLSLAYSDQETGQRGYLLSGDRVFLEPYRTGAAQAQTDMARLQQLMASDIRGGLLLDDVVSAADAWRREVGDPMQVEGPRSIEQNRATLMRSKELFDELRRSLATLRAYVAGVVAGQFTSIHRAQQVANVITVVMVVVAAGVASVVVVWLRRRLRRPLEDLLEVVDRVAAGERDAPVVPEGPEEVRRIGAAVESMRVSLLESARSRVEHQRQLTLRDERDRMAADLHDHTVQRVFALGLALSAEISQHPSRAAALTPLVRETDEIIRELRTMIFGIRRDSRVEGLRTQLEHLVADSARALGFSPTLDVAGPVDTVADPELCGAVLGVVREGLTNVARHSDAGAATVSVVADGGDLVVTVSDDGSPNGLNGSTVGHGLVNLRERAQALSGSCDLAKGPEGTTLTWRVPWA